MTSKIKTGLRMQIIETGKGMTYTIEINKDGFVTGIIGLINNTTEYELLKNFTRSSPAHRKPNERKRKA